MSMITAPLQHPPRRLGVRLTPATARMRRAVSDALEANRSFDGDRHASLSDLTLRSIPEARFGR